MAAFCGDYEIVKLTLEHPKICFDDEFPHNKLDILNQSLETRDAEIVQYLLQHPMFEDELYHNKAFISACGANWLELVKFLLEDPKVDPAYDNNFAIVSAAR